MRGASRNYVEICRAFSQPCRRGVMAAAWFSGNDVSIQPLEGSGLAGTEEVAETLGAYTPCTPHALTWHGRSLRVFTVTLAT